MAGYKNTRRGRAPKQFIIRKVVGDALAPLLTDGQLVVGRQTSELKPGDIVLVSYDGHEAIKRIERQQGKLMYLVGDNVPDSPLEWVQPQYIAAKIVWPALGL